MARTLLSLSPSLWPDIDKRLWKAACTPEGLFDEGSGNAAHLSRVNREQIAKGYSLWLGYLSRNNNLDPFLSPASRVTQDTIKGFVDECTDRVALTTTCSRLSDLDQMLRAIEPAFDRSYLMTIMKRVRANSRPTRDKRSKLVSAGQLWEAGFSRMRRVEQADYEKRDVKALQFMDGLLICILAARPIRLGNLQSMDLGHHLVRGDDHYMIVLPAEETKNHLAQEDLLPKELTDYIDYYLDHHRKILLRDKLSDAVWISAYRGRIAKTTLSIRIKHATFQEIGHEISPHLFRDCVATSIADEVPSKIGWAPRILNHKSPKTTEAHYIHANQKLAANRYTQVIQELTVKAHKRQRPKQALRR